MQCEEIRGQFAGFINGNTETEMHLEIEEHLRNCEWCRAEAEELNTLWIRLGEIPATPPGLELRERVESMVEAYAQGLHDAGHVARHVARPSERSHWRHGVNSWISGWWPRPALHFGFALSLLVVGLIVGRLWDRRPVVEQPSSEIAELRNELAQTRQMVALSLMQHDSASDRLRGVNWNYELQKPGDEVLAALLDTLSNDPNINVRLAAVDALRQFGDKPAARRGFVDAITRQSSPMVQIALIDLVVDLREKESVNTLKQLEQDQMLNAEVRERAGRGVAQLEF